MNPILQSPPERDEYGLPALPPGTVLPEVPEDAWTKLSAGDFSSIGLPMPSSMPTRAEAQREARDRSTEVLLHWNTLKRILESYEDVVRKRWLKKTKTQRTTIIQRAWPNMSATHRPDFEALRREGPELKSRGTRFREAYMWPCINVEDLVKGKTLLLFLNSRGRHPPHMFAHADFEATRTGQATGAIMPPFLNLHTMFLDGESVDTYGRLTSWDEDQDGMMKVFSRLAYQPGEGLWILEIQQRINHFLVDCCHAILHDVDLSLIQEAPLKPEPPSLRDSSEYPNLAAIAVEAPYRLPAQLDFLRLKTLVSAKCTSSEDHIRDLREDPGYFADFVGDWSEHRQEKLLDTNRDRHPVLDKSLFWERVIGNVIGDAYGSLVVWNIINQQLSHLAVLQEKYSNVINPKEPLPSEYMKALLTFKHTLDQFAKNPISQLKTGLPASPPYRSVMVREPHIPGSTMIRVHSSESLGADRILWLFSSLWNDHHLLLLGLPGLVDEIEKLLQNDLKEKAKISSWVSRVFSDLGLIARVRHELDMYQPWAAGFEHASLDHDAAIQEEFPRRIAKIAEMDSNLRVPSLCKIMAKFGTPADGRFFYPSDKRRSKQNTESMRKAEYNLDLFWEKVDDHCLQRNGQTADQAVQHLFQEERQLERIPEWIEPIKASKIISTTDRLHTPLSTSFIESTDSSSKFVPSQPKIKSKTRGISQNTSESALQGVPPPEEETQPTFTLKSRAFKVFKVLFHNPSQTDLPGEISWADFLFAMAATGLAPEKLYGSIWQFTPSSLDAGRSIQFHEPHPVAKITFRNARRIGRRLSRAYGWHGAMFALE